MTDQGSQARLAPAAQSGKRRARKPLSMAKQADRHALYQESVQCVEAEIDFVDDTYRALRKRRARVLREDFCGTANTACEWVKRRTKNRAFGVDLDPEVLAWGQENNVAKLGRAAAARVALLNENVLDVQTEPLDVVLAMNFSYWILKERDTMRRYFKRVRKALAADGLFMLDAYGGYESFKVTKDRHDYDDFTYIWDQAQYNPINGDMRCHIHFKFPDGSRMRNAFTYEWRLWTLPEVREILDEAGFVKNTVYWQGTDEETGEGDGVFEPEEEGEPDPAWIAYIVAEK